MQTETFGGRGAGVQRAVDIFDRAGLLTLLGVRFEAAGPGWCESSVPNRVDLSQQDGYIHAGVQATIADHTAGAAATTLLAADTYVLTVELKINLLRPATGEALWCRADVLKPGKMLHVVESEVHRVRDGERKLVAKATVTLAVMSSRQH